jgi:hypothetical protein
MAKGVDNARQIVRLCDDLLRIERGKLADLMRQKEQLQRDGARTREFIDRAHSFSPRLIEMSVERLSSIERQIHQIGHRIEAQLAEVNGAAVRLKAAEASLRSARQREAYEQRRADEIELTERVSRDWSDKAPIR